jgi:cytochrome c
MQALSTSQLQKGQTMNQKLALVLATAAGAVLASSANAAVDEAKAKQLAQKYNCLACHAVDKKLVGPAYVEVSKKYKDDKGALDRLSAKVKAGGSGVWGAIPMPPNNVPDADIKTLVEWVLSLH